MRAILIIFIVLILPVSCRNRSDAIKSDQIHNLETKIRQKKRAKLIIEKPDNVEIPEGMVWVSGGEFMMGAQDHDAYALPREKPLHKVEVDGFFMDITEVTNRSFKKFVDNTGYLTVAERVIDWGEIKKQVPPGSKKPHDSLLQPGSLVFKQNISNVKNLNDYSQWWEWKRGANWRHPQGPHSSIKGKEDFPVVHITYEDAKAYAKWAGKDLPTEAEWEAAARGTLSGCTYTWGNDEINLEKYANTWHGDFPNENYPKDGFLNISKVRSYPPNSIGLYDMAGNVWELTNDDFSVNYYQKLADEGVVRNPTGPENVISSNGAFSHQKVMKGGSFLCNKSYCSSYRISARMGMMIDSSSDHIGFRTVHRIKSGPGL